MLGTLSQVSPKLMNFTTKYWKEIIVVEILLMGNTAGNLSLASPPLLIIQIRFVTGTEALSLFHSLEGGGGGGGSAKQVQPNLFFVVVV